MIYFDLKCEYVKLNRTNTKTKLVNNLKIASNKTY